MILESASSHFRDANSRPTWQAIVPKLTVVEEEDLGMILFFRVNVTAAVHCDVDIWITPALIISSTTFFIERGVK